MHSTARPSAGHADEAGRRVRSTLECRAFGLVALRPDSQAGSQAAAAARAARVQMKLVEGESVLVFDGASVCPAVHAHPRLRTHGVHHETSSRFHHTLIP